MDFNSIDEDDVEKLRLAALMTFKKKSNVPLNTISSTSGEFSQSKFANGNSYNSGRNRGRFPTSNKSYNKRVYTNVGFRRPIHANNNLIAIIPTDGEGDLQNDDSASKNLPKHLNSKLSNTFDDNKSTNIQNSNNEVSTKFSRLENESGSEESEDSETERDGKEESDDGDILLLGEEDEDLDDLDKLMDIMEAEIAGGDVKSSKKEKKNLKKNKKKKEKSIELKNKNKLNYKIDESITMNQPEISNINKPQLKPLEDKLESIKTLEEIRNSSSQYNVLKSRIPLRSPSPPTRKRSLSPYSKLRKRSPLSRSPRRRSPTPDRYRYSPIRSRPYRRSLSPRRSPRRLSPLREKNLSPKRYSPLKSRYPYRSPSPRRRRRSASRDISPSRRRLSPLRRRSRSPLKVKSKSRSPKVRPPIRKRSPSPLKKIIKTRPISPTNSRRKDNKMMDDDQFKRKEKIKTIDKQVDLKPLDPVLEARKRKFESNKPIEPSSKKIILKKSNSVQVAIQTENKEAQNEKIEPEINPKALNVTKKVKKKSQAFQPPKNISVKMNNDLETINLRRVVKVNTSQEKNSNKKRPRIVFENDESNETLINKEDNFDQPIDKKIKTKTLLSETLEVSSASEEELSEEEDEEEEEEIFEENEDEESEKEDGQESSDSVEEYIDEEEDETNDEEEVTQEVHQIVNNKKKSIQRNDTVDLRTELKRRQALRLNMIQVEVKKKPESFYPARILQSAIRGVVGTSSSNEGKRKKHSQIPEISIKTEGNSDGRRVIVMNRDKSRNANSIDLSENQEDFDEEVKSYASVKRLKSKLKKLPMRLRTSGVNNDNTIQKGLRKVITRNINVTDFDQM